MKYIKTPQTLIVYDSDKIYRFNKEDDNFDLAFEYAKSNDISNIKVLYKIPIKEHIYKLLKENKISKENDYYIVCSVKCKFNEEISSIIDKYMCLM